MHPLPLPALPRRVRYAGVVSVAFIIAYFSFTGTVQPPGAGPWWDKRLHVIAYAALGLSIAYATLDDQRTTRRVLLVVAGAALYGAGIEIVQFFLPDRYFGIGDLAANLIGALVGASWLVCKRGIRYVPFVSR